MTTVDYRANLLAKVTEDASGCWLWGGATMHNGYGQFRYRTRLIAAHRASYLMFVGPIPEGLDLDHLCRRRNCVNPAHLEPVTRRENLLRGDTITARNAAVTRCPRGHAYDALNTYVRPNDRRRVCRRARRQLVANERGAS